MKPLRRPQKEKERMQFDRLVELIQIDVSQISQPEPPNPDIAFNIDNKIVGLEISELFSDNILNENGSALRKSQSLREKVLELAIKEVEVVINYPFELYVSYHKEISDREVVSLASQIAQIVSQHLRVITPSQEWKIVEYENNDPALNLHRLSIHINDSLDRHYYSAVNAGWIPDLFEQNLLNSISKKKSKLGDYSKNCHEIWLLLVELGGVASSFGNVENALNMIYRTHFDKIYLLRSLHDEVLEIKSKKPE